MIVAWRVRLAHREGEQGEQQPGDCRHEERLLPAVLLGDEPASGKSDRDADRAPGAPDRHHPRALIFGEVVAEEAGAGGVVACLPDPDHGAAEEELEIVAGEAGEEGGDAPDRHADADDVLADAPVAPVPEGHGRQGVDEEEGGPEEAEHGVADVEVFLDRGARAGRHPAVHVVEEIDGDHECEDVSRVASRHGWNYEVGLH